MFHISKSTLARAIGAGLAQQHAMIVNARQANYTHETALMATYGLQANAGRLPGDVWRDFDATAKTVMTGEDGSGMLADLEALSRNVNVGKLVSEYRRVGGADMEARTSLDGNHAKPVNKTAADYDGALIPVHSVQVGIQWREMEAMRADGYDGLRDDQEAATRRVRMQMVDNFINGQPGLVYKGFQSYGIKTSPNTIALDLGAGGLNVDLTSPATTYAQFRTAFIAILQALQGSDNNAVGNVTVYVSPEIWFNMLRVANPETSAVETMYDVLARMPGVAAVKRSDRFTGNELAAIILSADYIRPIVGMPVTTTPIARVTPMDEYHLLVWSAAGLQIKADTQGRSGVLYAAAQ